MTRNGQKRDAILIAAQKVFARSGYHDARTSEIAREAGVAEGTLYNYFPSREDIFLSLFEDRWRHFTERIRRRVSSLTDPNDKLKTIFGEAMKLFARNKPLSRIFLMESSAGSLFFHSRVATPLAEFLDLIEAVLIEGKKSGKYHPHLDTRVARMVIYGIAQSVLVAWIMKEEAPPDIARNFRFSPLKALGTIKIILKSGLTAPSRLKEPVS